MSAVGIDPLVETRPAEEMAASGHDRIKAHAVADVALEILDSFRASFFVCLNVHSIINYLFRFEIIITHGWASLAGFDST